MTRRLRTEIDDLVAPAGDGEVLVWPDAERFLRVVDENRRRRGSFQFEVLGRPAAALADAALAQEPVVMTGHQPCFLHPGVWAKIVVASGLAEKLGGRAEFLVVDSDALHEFALRWPKHDPPGCYVGSALPFAGAGDLSYGRLPRMPSCQWRAFFAKASAASVALPETAMGAFVDGFVRSREEGELDYVDAWGRGLAAVDELLGIRSPRFVRVSDVFSCGAPNGTPDRGAAGQVKEGWTGPTAECGGTALVLVAHLLLNAPTFAAAYNESMAEYRRRHGIRGHRHPIPDLAVGGGGVELPFWLLHDSGPRRRLSVSFAEGGAIRLWAGGEPICTLARADLLSNPAETLSERLVGWEVLPRALTLMMYARLFACDLFIHGVGGAKYDQITDGVIRRFFGVEPPAYGCISATLRLPLSVHGVTDADRRAAEWRIRDIRSNPQRHVPGGASWQAMMAITEREQAIAESRRLRRESPRDRAARRAAFARIRRGNEAVLDLAPGLLAGAKHDLAGIHARLAHDRVARSREWFFAMYPVEKLRSLLERLPFSRG
ncbi:MAG: hypothetical protein JXQ75_15085 [Phycisphaerae bacterium]|nr:hypothetical protein [Phycisphaerae bacterium]